MASLVRSRFSARQQPMPPYPLARRTVEVFVGEIRIPSTVAFLLKSVIQFGGLNNSRQRRLVKLANSTSLAQIGKII